MLHLRIKKVFFDKIKSGEKISEFRNKTEFYDKLLKNRPKKIVFHFQKKERLLVDVIDISIIPKPQRFINSTILTTDRIYKIDVSNPVEFTAI